MVLMPSIAKARTRHQNGFRKLSGTLLILQIRCRLTCVLGFYWEVIGSRGEARPLVGFDSVPGRLGDRGELKVRVEMNSAHGSFREQAAHWGAIDEFLG
jgi:hypothetical protein